MVVSVARAGAARAARSSRGGRRAAGAPGRRRATPGGRATSPLPVAPRSERVEDPVGRAAGGSSTTTSRPWLLTAVLSVSARTRSSAVAPAGRGSTRARGRNGRSRWCSAAPSPARTAGPGVTTSIGARPDDSTAPSAARRRRAVEPSTDRTAGAARRSRSRRPGRAGAMRSRGRPARRARRRPGRAPGPQPSWAARKAGTEPEPRSSEWSPHQTEVIRGRAEHGREGGGHDGGRVPRSAGRSRTARGRAGGQRVAQDRVGLRRAGGDRHDGLVPPLRRPAAPTRARPRRRPSTRRCGRRCATCRVERVDLGSQVDPLQARRRSRSRQLRWKTTPWPPSG